MTPPIEPHWTTFASPVVALLTAIIAAGVAVAFGRVQARIARQQADTARTKLQLELFDRRLVIYNAVKSAWGYAATKRAFPSEQINPYLLGTNGVRWLFEDNVVQYVEDTFLGMLIEIEFANASLSAAREASVDEQTKAANTLAARVKEIAAQQRVIDQLFSPYLKLKH